MAGRHAGRNVSGDLFNDFWRRVRAVSQTAGRVCARRRRGPGEKEHVIFYCENCGELVEDIHFDCKDIVDHFSKAMLEFWNDDARRTCKKCGKKVEKAQPVKSL